MDHGAQTTGSICIACGEANLLASQRYCRRCGLRLWEDGSTATHGALARGEVGQDHRMLPARFTPALWLTDGRTVYAAHGDALALNIVRLRLTEKGVVPDPAPVQLGATALRSLAATRRGVFALTHRLSGALAPTDPSVEGLVEAPELIPTGSEGVGLAPSAAGEIFVMTWHEGSLTLWGGAGARPLRRIATARAGPDHPTWMRLFVCSNRPGRGLVRFWGGGRAGEVDIELGAMSIRAEPRAPFEALDLRGRGPLHAFDHRPQALRTDGIVPVPLAGEPGCWGLMHLFDGRVVEAPPQSQYPLALVASDGAILSQKAGESLVVVDQKAPSLKRLSLGRRTLDAAVAAASAKRGFLVFNTREGEITRVVLQDLALDPDQLPVLSPERALGSITDRSQIHPWLPPLVVDEYLWLVTIRSRAEGYDLWRLPLE